MRSGTRGKERESAPPPRDLSVGRALDFTEAKVAAWDGDPAALQQEREQLMAWGENLYREATRLEKEKMALEQAFREEQQLRENMERDNALLAAQVQQIKYMGTDQAPAMRLSEQENGHIRKQLSTLSLEIGDLRRARDEAMSQLQSARSEHAGQKAKHDEYAAALADLQSSRAALKERSDQAETAAGLERAKARQTKLQLQEAQVELDVVQESLQTAREDNSAVKARLASAQATLAAREQDCEKLTTALADLEKLYLGLRQAFDEQTREYAAFTQDITARQRDVDEHMALCATEMETIVGLSKQYELETDAMRAQAAAMKERLAMTPVSMRDQALSAASPPSAASPGSPQADSVAAQKAVAARVREYEAEIEKLEKDVKQEKEIWKKDKRKLEEE